MEDVNEEDGIIDVHSVIKDALSEGLPIYMEPRKRNLGSLSN